MLREGYDPRLNINMLTSYQTQTATKIFETKNYYIFLFLWKLNLKIKSCFLNAYFYLFDLVFSTVASQPEG